LLHFKEKFFPFLQKFLSDTSRKQRTNREAEYEVLQWNFEGQHCVYVKILFLCENIVFMWKYCVCVKILCLCENIAFMWKYCVYVKILCLCENIVYVKILLLCENIVSMWKYCFYVKIFRLCENIAFMWKYCVYVKLLCLCENIVFMWKYCVYVKILRLCENIVFVWKYCVYVKILCLCENRMDYFFLILTFLHILTVDVQDYRRTWSYLMTHSTYDSSGKGIGPSPRNLPDNTNLKTETSMIATGFETSVPERQRPRNHAWNRVNKRIIQNHIQKAK